MIKLPKSAILDAYECRGQHDKTIDGPLQLQMGRDPWKVAVASMLIHRCKHAESAFNALYYAFSGPEALARADEGIVASICHLHRNRARQLIRFSSMWFAEYDDLRELPGVGLYVTDAVGLFCFGCTDLESCDGVLMEYARQDPNRAWEEAFERRVTGA